VSIEQDRFGRCLRVRNIARYTKDQQAERKKSQEHAASKRPAEANPKKSLSQLEGLEVLAKS
jgi:hypothetical protein